MGKRGPAPKPTELKLLHGARKDRINTNAPKPSAAEVKPPAHLSTQAKKVWARLAPDLIRTGVLTAWDVDVFATFCETVVLDRAAHRACLDSDGNPRPLLEGSRGRGLVKNPAFEIAKGTAATLVTLAGRFGLTPSDRSQIDLGGDAGDGGADLLSG